MNGVLFSPSSPHLPVPTPSGLPCIVFCYPNSIHLYDVHIAAHRGHWRILALPTIGVSHYPLNWHLGSVIHLRPSKKREMIHLISNHSHSIFFSKVASSILFDQPTQVSLLVNKKLVVPVFPPFDLLQSFLSSFQLAHLASKSSHNCTAFSIDPVFFSCLRRIIFFGIARSLFGCAERTSCCGFTYSLCTPLIAISM